MIKKVGRPHTILDEIQLEALAGMGCTMKEMASFFKCSVDTIHDNYSDALNRGRENGKMSVRRMMWEHGKKGNSVALKYLVHNVLKEKIEENIDNRDGAGSVIDVMEKLNSISTDMILRIVREHEEKPV